MAWKLLIPRLPLKVLPAMLGWTACAALMAGAFGIVHDQVTYTLAPEYYTHFKFHQFAHADPGGGPRLFVSVIGFLATWWVGLITGWLLTRCALDPDGNLAPPGRMLGAFLIMLGVTSLFSAGGYLYGLLRTADGPPEVWREWLEASEVSDPVAFLLVGYIHLASYIGGVVGFVVSAVMVRRARAKQAR